MGTPQLPSTEAGAMLLLSILASTTLVMADNNNTRVEKALSVFTVVKFPNSACTSSTAGRNGTCYTSSECSANSGTASGTCASSFGVCCVFEKSCGAGTVSQNTSYFTSTSRALGGSCSLTICKCSTDVCQLRLDFETFALNNPVTVTTVTSGPAAAAAGSANSLGACNVDQFTVTVPGGKSPPVICGTNTGSHMYVPASDQCNILAANIGSASTATTAAFTIKVTQVPCDSKTKAPNGCLQYFTGETGTVTTFNYNSAQGVLLTNQDYSICMRQERTYCAICYWSAIFTMSLPNAANGINGVDTNCGHPALQAPMTNDKGRLSKEEIEKMVNDAEAYKDEDEKQKDRIAAKNGLESFIFNMKSSLDGTEVKNKLSKEELSSVQSKLEDALRWLDSNPLAEKEEFVDKQKEVEEVTRPIIAKIYQQG